MTPPSRIRKAALFLAVAALLLLAALLLFTAVTANLGVAEFVLFAAAGGALLALAFRLRRAA